MTDLNPPNPKATRTPSASRQTILFVIIFSLAIVAAVFLKFNPLAVHPSVGKPAPELNLVKLPSSSAVVDDWNSLESVTGKTKTGNITMLHFWGTWCPPCRAEYPHLVEMMQGYQANPRVDFLPVTCGSMGDEQIADLWSQTGKFYQTNGIEELTTYSDPTTATQRATVEVLGEPGMLYPTTMIIGPDGRIAGVWLGYNAKAIDQMKSLIDELLAKPT